MTRICQYPVLLCVCFAWVLSCAEQPVVERHERPGYFGFSFEVALDSGLLSVVDVVPGSPAEAAGVGVGDVLTKVSGTEARFASHREALGLLQDEKIGAPVELVFLKDGDLRRVVVVPTEQPEGLAVRNEAALRCADSVLEASAPPA